MIFILRQPLSFVWLILKDENYEDKMLSIGNIPYFYGESSD